MSNKLIRKKVVLAIYDYEDEPLRAFIDYLIEVDNAHNGTVMLEADYYGYDGGITYEAIYEELETNEERAKRLAGELAIKRAKHRTLAYAIKHQQQVLEKLEEELSR